MPAKEMEEQLKSLVKTHHLNTETPLRFASWYRQSDPKDVYLLEVAHGVLDPGDGSWDTFTFLAPPELGLPNGASLHITYISPEEFFYAVTEENTKGYVLLREMQKDGCKVLFCDEQNEDAQRIRKVIENASTSESCGMD